MSYEVVWEDNARSEIAAEFVKGTDKVVMIDAEYQMDRALESDPIANGNPLSEGLFYIDCPPLRAIYSIDADAKRVEIARIRRIS